MKSSRSSIPFGVLLALTLSAPAHAQSTAADSDRANLLFKKGKAALNDGKYSDALRIYTEAWRLKQSPDIAANLAQAESELGKHRDAAEHFAFALAHLLPSSTDEQKRALSDGLDAEKKEVGTLHVTLEPADAALSVDGAPVTLPTSGDIFVEPGEHRCSVTHEGYDPEQPPVHVSKGGSQVLWIKLNPVGGPAVPASPPSPESNATSMSATTSNPPGTADGGAASGRSLVPALVGGGIAVAGIAAGIGFLLSGNSHRDKANDLATRISGQNGCSSGSIYTADCAALHDENQSGASARRLETVSFAVAGVAAVGTVAYLLWPRRADALSGRAAGSGKFGGLAPSVEVVRGVGTVGISGRF